MWTLTKVLDKASAGFQPGESIQKFYFAADGTVDFVETNLSVYSVKVA